MCVCVFPDSSRVVAEDLQNMGVLLSSLETLILARLSAEAVSGLGQFGLKEMMDTLLDLEISGELQRTGPAGSPGDDGHTAGTGDQW